MITTEAFFEGIQEEILKELGLASDSIYVAVAWITDHTLFDKLLEKLDDGVSVSLIVADNEINHDSEIDFSLLEERNGFFKFIEGELMHNKFCVIDKRVVITGSYNWTYKASQYNEENITVTQGDYDLAFRFTQQFNRLAGREEKESKTIDHSKVLKRFKVIQNLISLGDEDDLEYHCKKLQKEPLDPRSLELVELLLNKEYEKGLRGIEAMIQSYSQVQVYVDPKITALQLELKSLEFRIKSIDEEIAEKLREISRFNTTYQHHLGDLLKNILWLKEEFYKHQREKSQYHEQDYQQAKEDREEFEEGQKVIENNPSHELAEEEQKNLKKLYREATMLCHPDRVPEEHKGQAKEAFQELQEAYEQQDLERVGTLLSKMRTGHWDSLKKEEIDDLEVLKLKKQDLERSLNQKLEELQNITNSEVYKELVEVEDWEEYFAEKKEQLEKELEFWKEKYEEGSITEG